MNERILCAAIHFKDGQSYEHQPTNIESGLVITGYRHCNCYATLAALTGDHIKKVNIGREGQGFLTNLNRYVDRKEGYRIAKEAGQLLHNMHDPNEPILVSEDMY